VKTRLSLLALALCSQYTLAQDPMAPSLMIEELIVTAQKREQSIQDIPSSVSAVGGDAMQSAEISDFKDLGQMTAGLSLDSNKRNSTISMRGMSTDPDGGSRAVVDAYWNGAPVVPNVVFMQMFDLDRVEILRGAQGALQGRTSPAGAIQVYTRRAAMSELEGQIKTSVSEDGGTTTEFGVSLPLIEDELALRVAAVNAEGDAEGVENITSGEKQSSNASGVRASLSWEPTDVFDANLTLEYARKDQDLFVPVTSRGTGVDLDPQDRKTATEGPAYSDAQNKLSSLEMSYDMGEHTLTSLTSLVDFNRLTDNDSDFIDYHPRAGVLPEFQMQGVVDTDQQTLVQEVRLATNDAEFWDYTLGFFYSDSDADTDQAQTAFLGGNPLFGGGAEINIQRQELGVFLHNMFYVTDFSTLQLGLRWQRVDEHDVVDIYGPGGELLLAEDFEATTEAVTASVKYQYELSDATMVYAGIDQSFRPGGINVGNVALEGGTALYGEETSNSLEMGFKSTLMGGRVQLNGAVFYQQFDDYIYRVTGVMADANGGVVGDPADDVRYSGITANADATVSGAEVEFTALISEKLTLGGSIAYVDATFDDGQQGVCTASSTGCTQKEGDAYYTGDISGQHTGQEPNWSASLNAAYVTPVGDYDGYLRGLYKFTGARANDYIVDDGVAPTELGSYGTINLYAGIRPADYSWDISVWAKNLTNKFAEKSLYAPENTGGTDGYANGYVRQLNLESERMVGVSASYKFSL